MSRSCSGGGGIIPSTTKILRRLRLLLHLILPAAQVRHHAQGARAELQLSRVPAEAAAGAVAQAVGTGRMRALRSLAMEDNPFSAAARGALRNVCRPRNVTLTAYSEIENESLY